MEEINDLPVRSTFSAEGHVMCILAYWAGKIYSSSFLGRQKCPNHLGRESWPLWTSYSNYAFVFVLTRMEINNKILNGFV